MMAREVLKCIICTSARGNGLPMRVGSAAALSAHAPRKCIAWCDTLAEVSAPSAAALRQLMLVRRLNAEPEIMPQHASALLLSPCAQKERYKVPLNKSCTLFAKGSSELRPAIKLPFQSIASQWPVFQTMRLQPPVFAHLIRTRLIQRANQWTNKERGNSLMQETGLK